MLDEDRTKRQNPQGKRIISNVKLGEGGGGFGGGQFSASFCGMVAGLSRQNWASK